ncbi:MAG: hypothetical protein WBI40_07535 [Methylococcaceae bacterium]
MAITNYSTLQTAIANWLHRNDLTAVIPDFITLAESRINRVFSARGTELEAVLTATAGSELVNLPADFGSPIVLWLESFVPRQELILKLSSELNYSPIRAYPTFYAIKSNTIQFDRIADDAYPLRLRYVQTIDLATTDTNYVLENYPDIYLFSALVEAAVFIRDMEQMQIWQQKLDLALSEAQSSENTVKNTLLVSENNRSRFSITAG